jgi:hypothetical protein
MDGGRGSPGVNGAAGGGRGDVEVQLDALLGKASNGGQEAVWW